MKKILLAMVAATMLSGCELMTLACDGDFDCDNDFRSAAPSTTADMAR